MNKNYIEILIALLAKRANDDHLLDDVIFNHEMTLLGYQDEKAQLETTANVFLITF